MGIERFKIAVIGGGVAGITAAHYLSKFHQVTLFEAEKRLGGHTSTVMVDDPELGEIPVDTGFIVCNNQTYPLFHEFLSELKVPVRWSDMSFGYMEEETQFSYAATGLKGLVL
jgi:predicted NAD/FAD-binding protein